MSYTSLRLAMAVIVGWRRTADNLAPADLTWEIEKHRETEREREREREREKFGKCVLALTVSIARKT